MPDVKPAMRVIYIPILLLFAAFLFLPLGILFVRSFETADGINLSNYLTVLSNAELMMSFGNSVKISGLTAVITTVLAFFLAYSIHCTDYIGR